jgi:hypothetical protein
MSIFHETTLWAYTVGRSNERIFVSEYFNISKIVKMYARGCKSTTPNVKKIFFAPDLLKLCDRLGTLARSGRNQMQRSKRATSD